MPSMFAIIRSGGKQYRVRSGDTVVLETLPGRKTDSIKLDQVLLVEKDGAVQVGQPLVKGAYCEAEVVREFRGPKVVSFKYIRREKSATKIGHRQNQLEVKIKAIHA